MMKLSDELKNARITVVGAAELASMHPAHFRRLVRRGVFPSPKRTAKGRPYFDYDMLVAVAGVLRSGVGQNGEEIVFYRRRTRTGGTKRRVSHPQPAPVVDAYLVDLAEGLKQVGVPEDLVKPERLQSALVEAFGQVRPDLATAIPVLAQRLMAE
jgi:hypothetical protein